VKKFYPLALGILAFLFSMASNAQINVGVVANYPFSGNANDISGNGNNGTLNGPTSTIDRGAAPNSSYSFDGVANNIVVPHSPTLNFTGDRQSISFWFQLCFIPPLNDTHEYYIMSKMLGTSGAANGWHIFMRRESNNLVVYYRGINNGSYATQNAFSCNINNVEIGSWHHIVFILGSNNGTHMTGMLDNAYANYGVKNSVVANNTLKLSIGGGENVWNATTDKNFGLGRLDDIRIYNRALTDQDVAALYTQVPVTSFNQPVAITDNNGLCLNNDSLIITATSRPGLSYAWTGPNGESYSTNQVVIPNPTSLNDGIYTVVPNYDGCPMPSQTVTIASPLPRLALTGPTQICLNNPFSYSVTNTPNATYTWNYPGAGTPAGNTLNATNATVAESGNYSLTYALGGCVGVSDTIGLTVVQQYSIRVYDTICRGQSVVLAGAPQTTDGSYQDMYQSVTGCDSLVTTELFVKPLPQVSLGVDQQSCVGSTITLNATTDGTVVVWSNNATTPSINVTTTGNYWFEAELDGCTARDTVSVSFYLNPAADFTANDNTQCLTGNSFNFTPNNTYAPGTIFAWTFAGASIPTSGNANPTGIVWDADGSYLVNLVVTENGCVSTPASLNITVFPQPVADFTALPTQGCEPIDVKYNNTSQTVGLYTSQWILGDGNNTVDQSPAHTYAQAGIYNVTLTITDANGCMATESKPGFITAYPQPVAGFSLEENVLSTTTPILRVNDESLQSTNCFYYLNDGTTWTDCDFSASIPGSGTFTITQVVTSGSGCVDSTSQTFTVRPTPEVFIPNTFTPNGDFVNERFEPSISWIADYYLIVYDRWGGIVFETNDLFTYWNGRLQNYGSELPQDVYAYRVRYKPFNQDKDYYVTGSVTLIR
jgi:gliding motility-associated-like protein